MQALKWGLISLIIATVGISIFGFFNPNHDASGLIITLVLAGLLLSTIFGGLYAKYAKNQNNK